MTKMRYLFLLSFLAGCAVGGTPDSGALPGELVSVELSQVSTRDVPLTNMAPVRTTFGFAVADAQGDRRPVHAAVVRLELSTADGKEVFDESGKLDRWTWGHLPGSTVSFYYREVNPFNGPGTSFVPVAGEKYVLHAQVVEPDARPATAHIVARTPGS